MSGSGLKLLPNVPSLALTTFKYRKDHIKITPLFKLFEKESQWTKFVQPLSANICPAR